MRHTPAHQKIVNRAPRAARLSPRARAVAVVLLACALALVWGVAANSRAVALAPAPVAAQDTNDFSKFLHGSQRHASLACADCHQRAGDNSVQPVYNGRASLPGHNACQECHLPQFVQVNTPMCYICHTNVENNAHPPVKDFPGLQSFNMKFDHAQHDAGAARPAAGCAACHTPAGRRAAAMSIPATIRAHAQCYTCHTPNAQAAGRDIASCRTCHELGGYSRTPAAGRAFAVSFSHQTHGRRQGLNCNDCHNLRAGAPQRQQVTSTRPLQHFGSGRAQSCMACHNDQRRFNGKVLFGDADFNKCVLCHKGTTFRM